MELIIHAKEDCMTTVAEGPGEKCKHSCKIPMASVMEYHLKVDCGK